MDIVSRINSRLAHLRPSEQKVARFILDDLTFAASAPINELADKAGVSHASITRLARALECTNVRQLKMLLAQSAAVGERFISNKPVERQDIPAIYQAIHEILDLNAGLISDSDLQSASQVVTQADHVLIFGVGGGSTVMAQECHNRLFRLEVKSNAYSDPMLMRMTASTVNKDDVLICLSLSGVSPDVQSAAQIGQEYGAHVVAICPDGPLAQIADVHLPIQTREADYIFNPSASRYVMLAAIDMLASEVAVKNQRKSREKLRRLKHHLDEHRKGSERLPLGD
ncbi:MurR/RpiR family transcriptional regulator [Bowmanella yangjiangensis]|uniref:MurR/RpiR family transcriptional regulator n=1 Tax=Bowmanella yangjiangensis TaxID=2811230 RepID=A0ABS3CYX3_9ALTE|nr:MurR/RpiR family transcriptional regulator [Bowmanella yangjiangensis]MBN7821591.1 MurR/RpiR family transcriptional regulator [Bowmanella yangjiangensis]